MIILQFHLTHLYNLCDFRKTKASRILRILASSLSSNYHFVISGDLRVLQSCDICEKSLPHRLSSNFRLQFDVFGFLSPLILRSSELCNYETLQFNFDYHFVIRGDLRVLQSCDIARNRYLIDWVLISASNLMYLDSLVLSFYAQSEICNYKIMSTISSNSWTIS